MKKPKIHPIAELFPMMSEEELDDLAEDIKANGLIHPIVLDETGMLIDGRNRFEACRRAGIEPECETLNGQDPVAYIISQNDKRRHMTKGQRAMVVAVAFSLNEKQIKKAMEAKVSMGYVAQADVIRKFASDLVNEVISGDLALNEAYGRAQQRKKDAESDEGKMRRLRKAAPDLADQVTEEKLTLAEAVGALEARFKEEEAVRKRAEEQRKLSTQHLETVIDLINPQNRTVSEKAERFLLLYDRKYAETEITAELLIACAEVLKTLSKKWNNLYGQKSTPE